MGIIYLRPISDSTKSSGWNGGTIFSYTSSNLYTRVDEEIANDNTDYIFHQTSGVQEILFEMSECTITNTEWLSITNVRIYERSRAYTSGSPSNITYTKLHTHGNDYYGSGQTNNTSWATHYDDYPTNPHTGKKWTWNEISDMEIGIKITAAQKLPLCTQIYAEITYGPVICGCGPQLNTIKLISYWNENHTYTIRPNADGCVEDLYTQPVTGDHYTNVDEETCDNNSTYNWWDYPSEVSDMYECSDPSIPSDYDIKSVVIFAKVLGDYYWNGDMICKIAFSDNDCTNIYYSKNFIFGCNHDENNLGGDFDSIAEAWDLNPRTNSEWTINDINNLQIGCLLKSAIAGSDANAVCDCLTSADGGTIQLTPVGAAENWDCVDGGHCVNQPYVCNNASTTWQRDLYVMQNCDEYYPDYPELQGNPETVICQAHVYRIDHSNNAQARIVLYTHGTAYTYDTKSWQSGYEDTGFNLSQNPFTTSDWTWDEIANMEIGIDLYSPDNPADTRCCDIDLSIVYDREITTKIAVSQMYAIVNAQSEVSDYLLLPYPSKVEIRHNINTNAINFQSGNRKSYGIQRSKKTLILSGLLWDGCVDSSASCMEIINNVKTMAKRLEQITLDDFIYPSLCTDYNIISFTPVQISKRPNLYEWKLELEFVD